MGALDAGPDVRAVVVGRLSPNVARKGPIDHPTHEKSRLPRCVVGGLSWGNRGVPMTDWYLRATCGWQHPLEPYVQIGPFWGLWRADSGPFSTNDGGNRGRCPFRGRRVRLLFAWLLFAASHGVTSPRLRRLCPHCGGFRSLCRAHSLFVADSAGLCTVWSLRRFYATFDAACHCPRRARGP